MTVYAATAPSLTGSTATFRAAASGDQISGGTKILLVVTNGDATSKTVTIEDQTTALPEGAPASSTFADVAVTVANGTSKAIFIRDPSRFRDSSGYVNLTWSATTSVTWQAFDVS